ncbi:MAG: DnaB-like helicase N-terminal domain-containing protein, partial [Aquificaceae bacterium]
MISFDIEPPHDELAERAVLGAMLVDPESIPTVLEYLREEDFYVEKHRVLFSLIYKLWEDKGKDWDDIVLREYMAKYGLKDKIDMDFVYALTEERAVGALLNEAVSTVKEKSGLRNLMDLSLKTIKSIKDEPDFNNILDFLS